MAVENSELLALDALTSGNAPLVWLVLTTRSTSRDPKRFYRSREKLQKAIKRRWPEGEYAALLEFTTGYGDRSGGKRRPHWNVLLKGVPVEDLEELRRIVEMIWCTREDATIESQWVGAVSEFGGLMRYIALHFQKEDQAPPEGWHGQRFMKSRGYFGGRRMPEVREEARRSLRLKRLIWQGRSAELAELELALAESQKWSLVHLRPETEGQSNGGLAAGVLPSVCADSRPLDVAFGLGKPKKRAAGGEV